MASTSTSIPPPTKATIFTRSWAAEGFHDPTTGDWRPDAAFFIHQDVAKEDLQKDAATAKYKLHTHTVQTAARVAQTFADPELQQAWRHTPMPKEDTNPITDFTARWSTIVELIANRTVRADQLGEMGTPRHRHDKVAGVLTHGSGLTHDPGKGSYYQLFSATRNASLLHGNLASCRARLALKIAN